MVELTARIGFSLLIVLGLMWALARLAHRPLRGGRVGLVSVLGRQQLSKGACVAVVRVVDRAIVVGVTDGQVTLLGETDLDAAESYRPDQPVHRCPLPLPLPVDGLTGPFAGSLLSPATWSRTLRVVRGRTGRQS